MKNLKIKDEDDLNELFQAHKNQVSMIEAPVNSKPDDSCPGSSKKTKEMISL